MAGEPAQNDNLSRPQNGEEATKRIFDVFLCYDRESDEDRRSVKNIGNRLKAKGLKPWFDEWEVPPGRPWQRTVEQQIEDIKAAAVFVGQRGVDSWLKLLIEALLNEFVERNCPVIPVLLPKAPLGKPKLPSLLKLMYPIDFLLLIRNPTPDPDEDPFNRLIFGITERKTWEEQVVSDIQTTVHTTVYEPEIKTIASVLITSIGTSPVAISAVYDLLTKKEELAIDKVIVLCPTSEKAVFAYELLKEALTGICELQIEILPFEDVDNWTNVCLFLKSLYNLLNTSQTGGDTVYLSLASVGECGAAVMASIAPSFSCVKHFYNLIDPGGELFLSINELAVLTAVQRREAMYPDSERLILVDIPFEPRQKINQQIITRLLTATEDELTRMEYDQEIAGLSIKPAFDSPVVLPGAQIDSVLIVPLSKTLITATQFYTLLQHQENRNIHQVVLVYPAQATEITRKAELIRIALRDEDNVRCTFDHISGLEEVDSLDTCRRYQAELETVIGCAHQKYPNHRIDLAFSQVEESLVAMTVFAAQKKQLPYVYHSLITDEQLGKDIHERTIIEVLRNQDKEERNKRLFLRAYEEEGVYTKINLFKIPLFSI